MTRLIRRLTIAGGGVAATFALIAVGAGTVGAAAHSSSKSVKGKAWVAVTHQVGSTLFIAGNTADNVFGNGATTYVSKTRSSMGAVTVTAKTVTLFTSKGSLTGTGSATVTPTSATTATVTNGKLKLTKGTGSLKGHSFIGTFTGSGNPTSSEYLFNYKGTYK
jgi:hypothetical protein